ncbi:MAG: glutathione peroxidase [Deltaproteobacteria bacterium CG11_big_fil_rev_8_21_14_0_20_45_16]|nr:MAG: glutathione peroxidase [Deltaproteobacteria bacterium CG11_big_fil_rev_8_21_14_0_20_45_16]
MTKSIYDFKVNDIDQNDVSLLEYKNKVVLIVNVASECGFTPQYDGLEKLYGKYKVQGFAVLGFPCNQFGGQEPGDESEIKIFCQGKYNVSFPLFSKIEVNGPNADPLFEFLRSSAKGILGTTAIKWNFTKFLVGRDGMVLERYAPTTKPEALEADIEKALNKK